MSQRTKTQDLIDRFGVEIDSHLDREIGVVVSQGLQRQGDVIVIPEGTDGNAHNGNKVQPGGIPVVRGENGGNTHLLLADGNVFYAALAEVNTRDLKLGTLVVEEGATAFLAHPEHGYMGIGAGTYTIGRQREQADEARVVAD